MFEKPISDVLAQWNTETHVFTHGYIWITPSYLYKIFSFYLTEIGTRLRPNQKSFISNLDRVGLKVTRRRCNVLFSGQFRSIELSPKLIQQALIGEFGKQDIFQNTFEEFIRHFEDHFTPEQRTERHPQYGLTRVYLQQPDSDSESEDEKGESGETGESET